mmetsp:Transcript_9211/g.19708  ORF Transcript_9211/g.19708 Transcript_9211/m.19708 type:complete len:206 (+) Transcript_9211:96-713(+)
MASMAFLRSPGVSAQPSCSYSKAAPVLRSLPTTRRSMIPRALPAQELVQDVMTKRDLITCKPEDTVDQALEMLVNYKVTGLPVVDDSNKVVGVVSDFDLLALDTLGRTNNSDLFPVAEQTWQAFKNVQSVLAKGTGKRVKDVMTANPVVVTPNTNLNDATSILLTKKIRRLPVVDKEGHLIGLVSRRDVVKAALAHRKAPAAAVS